MRHENNETPDENSSITRKQEGVQAEDNTSYLPSDHTTVWGGKRLPDICRGNVDKLENIRAKIQ